MDQIAPRIVREFPTWKTIKIGRYRSAKKITKAFKDNGFRIGDADSALDALRNISFVPTERDIDLVRVYGHELDFWQNTSQREIYDRAGRFGLGRVPPETGPELRLQYPDQPLDDWMLMAMYPISTSGWPSLRIFGLQNSSVGQWLHAHSGEPNGSWRPNVCWVFEQCTTVT
jgi:hypothetical protein